jgi:hypothetical protein
VSLIEDTEYLAAVLARDPDPRSQALSQWFRDLCPGPVWPVLGYEVAERVDVRGDALRAWRTDRLRALGLAPMPMARAMDTYHAKFPRVRRRPATEPECTFHDIFSKPGLNRPLSYQQLYLILGGSNR